MLWTSTRTIRVGLQRQMIPDSLNLNGIANALWAHAQPHSDSEAIGLAARIAKPIGIGGATRGSNVR